MKCQHVSGGRTCSDTATHKVDVKGALDPWDLLLTFRVAEHAGFEAEVRHHDDNPPPPFGDCPRCGRSVLTQGGLLVHTIPGTFDLCA